MYEDNRSDRTDESTDNRLKRRSFLTTATAAAGTGVFGSSAAATPYDGSRHAIPGRIEAEDYDTDGSFWAFRDSTAGNAGGAYRSDDVDIEYGGDNFNIGWTESEEWLNYSATVESSGTYEVTAHVASNDGGGTFTLLQDQRGLTTFDVPDTGGWQSWTTVTARDVSFSSGTQVIRIYVEEGGFNLDWLEAGSGGDGPPEDGGGTDNYPNLDGDGWELVWSDEFDRGSIDASKWSFATGGGCGRNGRLNTDCSWGNQEEQYYTDGDNAWVENDRLIIEAREELAPNGQNPYTSARLVSEHTFEKQFGRVEVRARLPATQALWPAIWMLGQDISSVSWPDCGEIDIMELTGDDTDTVHQTIHGPGYSGGGGISADYSISGDFTREFHDFQLTWYDDMVKFWVDGTHVNTLTPADVGGNQWVFNDQFFLLLNVAVGGIMPGYPDERTQLPQRMEVEYVRVYDPI
ncbi:family 16 glycosylhydrolase [Natrinema caseinilyticum]|uniref:family 16 glycosylhydrolase n=1 Tax=Natrinema caseinilyticum TaxID=2961570 RepID=UPI0020C3C7C3|nr:family 16 glycosylhydrolase [Natrinema caseinilyticum]